MLTLLLVPLLHAAPAPNLAILYSDAPSRWAAQRWRELPADGSVPRRERDGTRLEIASFGGLPVRAVLRSVERDGETAWYLRLTNDAPGTVVGVVGPALEGLAEVPGGALYLPNRAGHRLPDPWPRLTGEPRRLAYPVPASMQFLAYAGPSRGAALHVLDRAMAYKELLCGGPARRLGVVFYPFCEPGATWQAPPVVWQRLSGGWHQAADRYRRWFGAWAATPRTSPQLRRWPIMGGTTILARPVDDEHLRDVLKAQEVGTYAKAWEQAQYLKSVGFEGTHLVGWFGQGHDTTYPDYPPGESMGGEAGLRELLAKMRGAGLIATAYLNARLANVTSPTLAAHPSWPVSLAGGGRWEERYGNQAFVVCCPGNPEFRAHLIEQVRRLAEYGADGAQLDQIGAASSMLCFEASHGHATPADVWADGYRVLLTEAQRVARAIRPGFWFWIEGAWEGAGQFVDASQGGFWPDVPGALYAPEMYRYAMPRHRLFGDPSLGGIPFWCPTDIRRARRIFNAVGELLWEGTFHDDQGLATIPSARARWFEHRGEAVLTIHNTAPEEQTVPVAIDPARLGWPAPPREARAIAADRTVPVWRDGPWQRLEVSVPGGQVEAVRLCW